MYLVITKGKYRDVYYLIDVSGDEPKTIAESDDPLKLRSKMNKLKFER